MSELFAGLFIGRWKQQQSAILGGEEEQQPVHQTENLAIVNATGLPGGCLRSSLPDRRLPLINATGLPGGCLRSSLRGRACSREPNDPPGKPAGFKRAREGADVAGNLTIHRASRRDS